TYEQRKQLEFTCESAFFIAIVLCQWAVLIICKTRRNSILEQGMKNRILNGVLIFEIILVAIVSYMPCLGTALNIYPMKFHWWLPALFSAFLIMIYDEVRKHLIRKHPGGWMERQTYF
ncbi:unnamed protein product, partial [Rotaria sp. Silwood2]